MAPMFGILVAYPIWPLHITLEAFRYGTYHRATKISTHDIKVVSG